MFLTKRKLAGLLVFCFLLGGALATVLQGYALDVEKQRRKPYRQDLVENLSLSDAQITSLDRILDEYSHEVSALNKAFKADYRSVKTGARDRIRGILDPEQLAKFNRLMEERDARKGHKKSH